MASQWFEISNDGWRRMNAGRPPYELVKELVQNILDEDFQNASINFKVQGNDFILVAEDDVQGGIANSALVTTVFLTGKEDSHLKRGRKGRGLKEFLSVCYKADVETVGKTISFLENGSREEISNSRIQGTKITCYIREQGWDKAAVKEIEKYLSKVIIYSNGNFTYNGKPIQRRNAISTCSAELSTHIVVDGIQQTIYKRTNVCIYEKKEKEGWIFEMGIPVSKTEIPYDIDVQQRIPMNDNRNEVSEDYLNSLKTYIIASLIDSLTKKDFLSWAGNGVRTYNLTRDLQEKIARLFVEGSIHSTVLKSSKNIYNDKAEQKGKQIFDARSMNHFLQSVMTNVMDSSEQFIREIEENCQPIDVVPTPDELLFIEEHKKLVKDAIGIEIDFRIVEKEKDTEGNWTCAFHESYSVPHSISYNRSAVGKSSDMGKNFFKDAFSIQALDLLIHELAHEKSDEHFNMEYINAVTNYGARIAKYFLKKTSKVVTNIPVVKRENNGSTVFNSVKDLLTKENRYMTLNEIYQGLGADSVGAKAGIRGVLNRNCLTETSEFERHQEGGLYKIRNK